MNRATVNVGMTSTTPRFLPGVPAEEQQCPKKPLA